MNKRKQNNAYGRPLRKTAGPKRGPAGLSHYSRNYKPTWQAAKKNKMVGTKNIKPIIIRSPVSKLKQKTKRKPT